MDRTNQDAAGEKCVYNDDGESAFTDGDKMKAWAVHYAWSLSIEFE